MAHLARFAVRTSAICAILMAACTGPFSAESTSTADDPDWATLGECPVYASYPVVWPRQYDLKDRIVFSPTRQDGTMISWKLERSSFKLVSSYWALNPNYLFDDIDPEARQCVSPDDRWMVIATFPEAAQGFRWRIPFGDPSAFDDALWDEIIAHPWQLDRLGPEGSADQAPHYRGVVRFTDEPAVTATACDDRTNVVIFRGEALAPEESPPISTPVCTTPRGIEEPPDLREEDFYLPIGGYPTIEDGELIIIHEGMEHRYVPITIDEFVAAFDRDAFFDIEDPLIVLEEYEAESFQELDNPSTPRTSTTTSQP